MHVSARITVFALLLLSLGVRGARGGTSGASHTTPSPLAGHWEADLKGDGKIFTFVLELSVRGDSLGGTVSIAQRDGEFPIAGTVKGNHIHFEQFGIWDGTLEKSQLKLKRGLDGGKIQNLVAHRVAAR